MFLVVPMQQQNNANVAAMSNTTGQVNPNYNTGGHQNGGNTIEFSPRYLAGNA